jgi:putative protease
MAYKPELLVTASTIDELKLLAEAGADAFVIGDSRFGTRLAGSFTEEMIREAVAFASPQGKSVYVSMNNLISNERLIELPGFVSFLYEIGVNAIIFGDPAVLMAAREHAPGMPLHWNAEMTSTNFATAEYWSRRGATRYVLARELNMEQIEDTKAKSDMQIQVQVHGMTNIYHSKRYLVDSYLEHQSDGRQLGGNGREQGLFLTEAERPGEQFPIFEDEGGTHIMSSDDICILENIHELLAAGVDSLKIEGILKPAAYNEIVVKAYRKAIDAYMSDPAAYTFEDEWLEPIREQQNPDRELSYGFFYKEQVY